MNDFLFYACLAALLYYFLVYLPAQKKPSSPSPPRSTMTNAETQTEPITYQYEPGPEHDILNGPSAIKFPGDQSIPDPELITELTQAQDQIKSLQTQLKAQKQSEESELSQALDQIIKTVTDINETIDK
jgi:hypothetical protein